MSEVKYTVKKAEQKTTCWTKLQLCEEICAYSGIYLHVYTAVD